MPNVCEYTSHETEEEVRRMPITFSGKSITTCHKHWWWEMEARWRGNAQGRKTLGFSKWNSLERGGGDHDTRGNS